MVSLAWAWMGFIGAPAPQSTQLSTDVQFATWAPSSQHQIWQLLWWARQAASDAYEVGSHTPSPVPNHPSAPFSS